MRVSYVHKLLVMIKNLIKRTNIFGIFHTDETSEILAVYSRSYLVDGSTRACVWSDVFIFDWHNDILYLKSLRVCTVASVLCSIHATESWLKVWNKVLFDVRFKIDKSIKTLFKVCILWHWSAKKNMTQQMCHTNLRFKLRQPSIGWLRCWNVCF